MTQYKLNHHRDLIENLLAEAVAKSEQGDHVRALASIENARHVLQELYYDIWMQHHTSGTGGAR